MIFRVDEPTDWCSGMVLVPKSADRVRICVDLGKLNESVLRERVMLPSVEHTLAQLTRAKYFSTLDANSGFWQVILAKASRKLTTFITPYGRYPYNRLPFGITSAPDYFQKQMSQMLAGLPGVVCMMGDILIHGANKAEHDKRLRNVCSRLEKNGATLNLTKCVTYSTSVKYLGQIIYSEEIRSDPDKIRAITDMPTPLTVPDVQRFLGMVNHVGKFIPHLSLLTELLRSLLSKKNAW